jgi:hypothetical protein
MSDIESDWQGDDDLGGRPYGGRPYGGRPYGGKPYGGRPYGGRPYGGKPYGGKPYGGKPYGGKPYGGKPYGGKPYGGKPYGGRLPGADEEGPFDPEEWGDEIAELVCQYSAAIRAGSTLVFGESAVQVPVVNAAAAFQIPPVPPPPPVAAALVPTQPGLWQLGVSITAPLGLVSGLAARPDLVAMLKGDLAEALARGLDQAVLVGSPAGPGPQGIEFLVPPTPGAVAQLLGTLRAAAAGVRANNPLRGPSWILTPGALTAIAQFLTANGLAPGAGGRTVDTYRLLTYDGVDGGTLLGYPFLTSRVNPAAPAGLGVFFSADWREALIGLNPSGVIVSVGGAPAGGATINVSMPLDFDVRWPPAFTWL